VTREEILETLAEILQDLLADESIVLTMETARGDVPGWDSFNYVNFMVAVEVEFGIKFSVADVEAIKTVGDMVQMIRTLTG
jgi:acyl carrier protein